MGQRTVSIRIVMLGVACAVTVLLGLLGAVMIQQARNRMAEASEENAIGYARLVALAHGQWIAESSVVLAAVAGVVDRGEIASGQCTATLAALLARAEAYDTFLVVGPNGDLWCAPKPIVEPVNFADRAYLRKALETKRFSTGDYVVGRVSGKRTLPIAYPVLDASGAVQAVIVAGKRLAWFREIISDLDLPDETHVAVIDSHGVVLAHYPVESEDEEVRGEGWDWASHAMAAREIGTYIGIGHDGVERIHAYTPLGDLPGTGIIVSQPSAVALAPAHAFLTQATLALGAALLLSILLLLTVLRGVILMPLARLVAGTRAVQAGDRSWRTLGRSGGSTEMAELYQSFDGMLAELDAQEERIRAQAADLERSNSDLQNFAYTVSHDLREPLRTMGSFIRLIERRYADRLDADGLEFMHFVTDASERMSRMLDAVLEFSRIETRGNTLKAVDLDSVLDQVLGALGLVISDSGAKIHRDPLPPVSGDAEQLARVLQNLITNAIKFRKPDENPDITVTARLLGGMWEIAVADRGVGLPAEGRDQLFVLFRRLVTRDQVPGDGVGLAICKRIVERHGGTIGVESQPGEGATFRFTLPYVG